MKKDSALNRDKLFKLIGYFDEALNGLRDIRKTPKDAVLASRDRFAMEHLFYRLAMTCIDICFHLATSIKGKVPETYKNCFQLLAEAGIIDSDTKERLSELAGLRNLIAHVYWELDYSRLYDFLEGLEALEPFREAVIRICKKE